jgi:hypothetical protein
MNPYDPTIPAAGDDPSVSQGQIQSNFSTLAIDFAVNHVGYGTGPAEGKHKFVEMPARAVVPPTILAGEGAVYTKSVAGTTQLFYTPDATGNEYQLTNTKAANFAKFGTNTHYQISPSLYGGFTYLPGGLIMQYGSFGLFDNFSSLSSSGVINFPIAFSSVPFTVNTTLIRQSGSTSAVATQTVVYNTVGLSSFTWALDSSSTKFVGILWTAIGI